MTQQDDITQRVLTDDDFQSLWNAACQDSPQAPGWNRHIRYGHAVVAAALSKLRAPVADTIKVKARDIETCDVCVEVEAYGSIFYDHGPNLAEALGRLAYRIARGENLKAPSLAMPLASAPVAKPDPEHFKPPFANCSFRMCDLPGQCRGEGKCHHPASAPVAGEAVAWVSDTAGATDNPKLAETWRKMGWPVRPLVYGDAAPQASAQNVRNAALYLLREARKMLPAFATAEAIGAWSEKVRKFGASEVIDVPPQADKDGGQQRAAFDHPVFAFLLGEGPLHGVHFGERAPGAVGKWWWRKDLRAALSAPQAEQGERDA